MTLTLTHRPHGRTSTDTPTPPPADRGRAWLTRLFAGDFAFPAVQPADLAPAARPPAEFDAAARAVGCRDLFVIDAPERPSRERVVADIARNAALKGERVLVLSPDPTAADRVVEMLTHGPAVSVVRALADDENPYRPSPAVTRLTSANAGAAHADKVIREASSPAASVEAKLAPITTLGTILADLRERAVRFEQIEAERSALAADAEDSPASLRAEHEAALARLTAERESLCAKRREKETDLAATRQHCTEAAAGAKKTGFFARLLGKGKAVGADPAELERHAVELEREIKELAAHEAKLGGECDHAATAFAAERDRLCEARRVERDAKLAALSAEADATTAVFRGHRAAFEAAGFAAPWPTVHSVDTGRAALDAARAAAEHDVLATRDRAAELTSTRADIVREFLAGVRVVVGTP
ncbi:MAG TPA: hypothetical protein VMZ71_05805, partial [Gemmataceae bacterium]|nr:hypothetical protein [Gemmataceae bacterium]